MFTTIVSIITVIAPIISLLATLGIFKLLGAKLESIGDQLEKNSNDKLAHVERDTLYAIGNLLEKGDVPGGLSKLKEILITLEKK